MRVVSIFGSWLCAGLLVAGLSACGSSDSGVEKVIVIGEKDDPFEDGLRLSPGGQLVHAATAEGLVAFDAEGRVIPALADRWTVTDDGKSYIFRLRDGNWLDGPRITAKATAAALRDVIGALRRTPLGLDLAAIEDIRVMAGRVVEIRLVRPLPHFLQLLAQPELGLTDGGKSGGPMALERKGDTAVLTPVDPVALGLSEVRNWEATIRRVELRALPPDLAVEQFNRGEADIVLGGRIQDFPYSREVGILRGTIQLDPVAGLFGLQVMNDKGFLSEPENREAIAMAIDREKLISSFGLSGWSFTTRIVSPGLEGDIGTIGERWAEMTLENRQSLASTRVSYWMSGEDEGQDKGGPIALTVWLPQGPGSQILFENLRNDLSAMGIRLSRAAPDEDGDLRLVDDVARYPRAFWFLNRLSCVSRRGVCDADADKLAAEAMTTADPEDRAALLAEAEAELTTSNVFIPLGSPVRWSLVRGDVNGFSTNRWGWHPLMPMAKVPR